MSRPSSVIEPAVGSIRRSTVRPTVDLPQPDSPTRPSVSCGAIVKETPSTARTCAPAPRKKPPPSAKCFLRSATSSTGPAAFAPSLAPSLVPSLALRASLAAAISVIAASENLVRAPARRPVSGPFLLVGRIGLQAAVLREGAARREGAAGRQVGERRHHAGDLLQS